MKFSAHASQCLVVLSGGQDSTTCLYWAKERFDDVCTVTFDYGQRHRIELASAEAIARLANVANHETIDIKGLMKSTSPLIDIHAPVGRYGSVEELPGGIEPTFIPCRNILFLTIAANRAVVRGIEGPRDRGLGSRLRGLSGLQTGVHPPHGRYVASGP